MNHHSTFSNLIKDSEPCLICGAPTLERHFQVIKCNACAAFFRRSIKIRSSYRCQRNHGTCNLSVRKIGRPLCRYCRLKKCYEVGMKSEDENDAKFEIAKQPILIEAKVNNCAKDSTTRKKGININVEKVYEEVKSILEKQPKCFLSMGNLNLTKKFAAAVANFIQSPKDMALFDGIRGNNSDHDERTKEYEKYLVNVAKMLMNIEYYAALPFSEKFALYKKFWQKFQIIEKSYTTLLCFGDNIEDFRLVIDSKYYINIKEEKLNESSEVSNETALFIFPLFAKMKIQLEHIKKTGLTLFEFSYICQIILWSLCAEIEEISLSTCALAEEMMQRASDELHDYYVNDLHMRNYAARQADLIKHVRLTEFVYRDRRQMMAANQIFNFIKSNVNFNVLT